MGNIHLPKPVKLFVGMLSPDPGLFDACADFLRSEYGPIDYRRGPEAWNFTDYYHEEMGADLFRTFIFFERLMDPGKLPGIKHLTNRLEERFAIRQGDASRRRINLDPGYVTEAKVVLATTKDYAHRVYIGQGIYAEVTLRYQGERYTPLDTTYPDYQTNESIDMFSRARELLRASLK
jgi:hypothetical protein